MRSRTMSAIKLAMAGTYCRNGGTGFLHSRFIDSICDQICQKGSYTRTVSSLTFHRHSTHNTKLTVDMAVMAKSTAVCFH